MVSVTFDRLSVRLGQRAVVAQVSATLAPGSLVGIIGPNGAGKSTLVRAMLGLVPLSEGSALIDGQPVTSIGRRAVARSIAYLPQGQTLHWPLSVERLVALGRLPHLGPMSHISDTDREQVAQALDRADVRHLCDRIATELSGGERARVMLARALAVGAPGLVADEPLAALDPGHQLDVMELLAREARAGGLVIAVLHDLMMAARYCDRLLLMREGLLIADGAPAEVLTPENLAAVYGIRAHIDLAHAAPLVVPLERIAPRPD